MNRCFSSFFTPRGFMRPAAAGLATLAAFMAAPVHAVAGMPACADQRVKTTMLPVADLAAAEAACGRILAGYPNDTDRQKAAFYRGLMRFLQVVQTGMAREASKDGALNYAPPTLAQLRLALTDIETAIGIDGPMKGDALAMRVTVNQLLGNASAAHADIGRAMQVAPNSATPYVQRALEHERANDIAAALADLDRAIEIDPAAGTARAARGRVLRRLGLLVRAKADFASGAALGPPFRRLALIHKSEVELRAGDLKAAYDDLLTAARESGDMSESDAKAMNADLLVRAGDLALEKMKDLAAAERHYRDASQISATNWNAMMGLARIAEQRGDNAAAAAIYQRILAATEATPRLYERMLASFRLTQLTRPMKRSDRSIFRNAFDVGVTAGKGSPDGLKRVAFVIGESDYLKLASLPNPRRDAAVIANALAEMGFDAVEIAENLDASQLRGVPGIIAEKAASADVVMVFYAGHGVEANGVNYLIPVDAAPESDRDLKNGALALADLTAAAANARRGSLVVVDACRDDPFVEARAVLAARSSTAQKEQGQPQRLHSGLAITPAVGARSVVFHSTQPGQVALDGEGLDSPFVRALLETLATPNQPFQTVVQETITRVSEKTQGLQIPAAYGTSPVVALLPPTATR